MTVALPERELLSPAEVAHVLGVSRPKVYALMAAGKLPNVHVGSSRRIFRDAVDAYLRELRELGH